MSTQGHHTSVNWSVTVSLACKYVFIKFYVVACYNCVQRRRVIKGYTTIRYMGTTVKWKLEQKTNRAFPPSRSARPVVLGPAASSLAMAMQSMSFHGTLGAASIGFYFSCVVFGVLTTQVVVYFQRFPNDRLVYKALVRSSCVFVWSMII